MTIKVIGRVDHRDGSSHVVSEISCNGPGCTSTVVLEATVGGTPDEFYDWSTFWASPNSEAENKDFCSTPCYVGFCRQVVKAADQMEVR